MRFSLKNYSLFAISYLTLHQSGKGEVVYTDIDPDKILDNPGEGLNIDIDNNGTIDFTFLNSSFTIYNVSFKSYQTVQDILVGPHIQTNALAGNYNHYSGIYYDWTWYLPFAIENAAVIDDELYWQTYGVQIMAIRTYFMEIYHFDAGYWYPLNMNKFLGIRFIDSTGNNHYGWLRCDVKDEGRTLIIKDYAYNTTANEGIIAGDSVGTSGIDASSASNIQIYYSYNMLFVQFIKQPSSATSLKIFDITGHLIYERDDLNQNNAIPVNGQRGIYIVRVEYGNEIFVQKVFI